MSVTATSIPPAGTGGACPHCGEQVRTGQRYCLTCGRACSPVRFAFLDVLQSEHAAPSLGLPAGDSLAPATATGSVSAGPSPSQPRGGRGWLSRNSGALALLSVLLTSGLIGLLVGHWLKSPTAPAPRQQVVRVEYPNGLPAAAATAPTAASNAPAAGAAHGKAKPGGAGHTRAKPAATHESPAAEEREAKSIESKPAALPQPVHTKPSSLQKLGATTGRKHREEINKLANGTQPIETGG